MVALAITDIIRHTKKINSCEVVAIATNRKIKISKKIKIYADANNLIKSERLDIISIATIPKLQENLIAKIIKNNTNLFWKNL